MDNQWVNTQNSTVIPETGKVVIRQQFYLFEAIEKWIEEIKKGF